MRLSGRQLQQMQEALLSAFPSKDLLRAMVRFELDVNLDAIAGGESQRVVIFNLLGWAERHGRVADLIDGAHREVPGNLDLQQLVRDAASWDVLQQATSDTAPQCTPAAESPTTIDIFLSYSHHDREIMRQLYDDLRAAGYSVWIDEGLEAGTPQWQETIDETIQQAQCMVVVLSPDAKSSRWVGAEIGRAQRLNKTIYPVLVRGEELSSVPLSLVTAHRVDLRQDYRREVNGRLLPALQRALGGPEPATLRAPASPARPTWPRYLMGAVAVAVVLIGLAGAWNLFGLGTMLGPMVGPGLAPAQETGTPQPAAINTPRPPSIDPASVPENSDDGRLTLSGMAAPGAEVEILVDGLAVGTIMAVGDGRWSYVLELDEPGLHVVDVRAMIGGLRIASAGDPFQVLILPTPIATLAPTPTPLPVATVTQTSVPPEEPAPVVPRQPYGPGWVMKGGFPGNTSWNVHETAVQPPFTEYWTWNVDGALFADELTYARGVAYVTGSLRHDDTGSQMAYAIEIGGDEPLWSYKLGDGKASIGNGVTVGERYAFVGAQSSDGLSVLDLSSGARVQVYSGFHSLYERNTKVDNDGVAFAASQVMRAVDTSTLEVLWFDDENTVRSDNALTPSLFLTGSNVESNCIGCDTHFDTTARDRDDGTVVWRTSELRGHRVMTDGEKVYTVISSDSDWDNFDTVAAYNGQTGELEWSRALDYPIGFWSLVALGDGKLFFAGGPREGDDRRIYVLDSVSGQIIDIIVYPSDQWLYDLAVANGHLYVGTRYNMEVYETENLTKVWSGLGTTNGIVIADGMLITIGGGATISVLVPATDQ